MKLVDIKKARRSFPCGQTFMVFYYMFIDKVNIYARIKIDVKVVRKIYANPHLSIPDIVKKYKGIYDQLVQKR